MKLGIIIGSSILLLAGCLYVDLVASETLPARLTITKAVERSLPYLERDGAAWMEGRIPIQDGKACVSCHVVAFAVWSHNEAGRRGIRAGAGIEALTTSAIDFLALPDKGRVMSWGPLILGMEPIPLTADRSTMLRDFGNGMLDKQQGDGHWRARGQFPSQKRTSEESDAVATMWTMLSLSPGGKSDTEASASREKAGTWLESAEVGVSNEWLLTRLLVEHRFGDAERRTELLQELLAQQHDDGGWGWLSDEASNAFSSGQTLYALRVVGLAADHPAVEMSIAYLLGTQRADGTWVVDSELTSDEPSPGKDYVYTYWGTAWAVIGLARTLPEAGGNSHPG